MIGNGDQVSVKVAGNAEIVMELCAYTADGSMLNADVTDGNGAVTPESVSAKAAADGNTEVFSYTGEAATLTFTYEGSGSGYLHTMAVTNEMEETEVNPQDAMPEIRDFGSPDSMTASARSVCMLSADCAPDKNCSDAQEARVNTPKISIRIAHRVECFFMMKVFVPVGQIY